MRRINVVKPFNFLHPDGTRQAFGVGVHQVGTYRKPVWDRTLDAPKEGEFTEHEIGEHPYVVAHCGKMPSPEELLAEAERLREQAEAMTKQAGAVVDGPAVDAPPAAAADASVKPNTRTPAAAVKPNTKQ